MSSSQVRFAGLIDFVEKEVGRLCDSQCPGCSLEEKLKKITNQVINNLSTVEKREYSLLVATSLLLEKHCPSISLSHQEVEGHVLNIIQTNLSFRETGSSVSSTSQNN